LYNVLPKPELNTRRSMWACPPPGTYKNLHTGTHISAAITAHPEALVCELGTHEKASNLDRADSINIIYDDGWVQEPLVALAGSMGLSKHP
jgi:hypothetical protein